MKDINFFEKKIINIKKLFPKTKFKFNNNVKNVKTLKVAEENDLTFFDSIKYKSNAEKTQASYCLTSENLAKYLPVSTEKIIVKNVIIKTC